MMMAHELVNVGMVFVSRSDWLACVQFPHFGLHPLQLHMPSYDMEQVRIILTKAPYPENAGRRKKHGSARKKRKFSNLQQSRRDQWISVLTPSLHSSLSLMGIDGIRAIERDGYPRYTEPYDSPVRPEKAQLLSHITPFIQQVMAQDESVMLQKPEVAETLLARS